MTTTMNGALVRRWVGPGLAVAIAVSMVLTGLALVGCFPGVAAFAPHGAPRRRRPGASPVSARQQPGERVVLHEHSDPLPDAEHPRLRQRPPPGPARSATC